MDLWQIHVQEQQRSEGGANVFFKNKKMLQYKSNLEMKKEYK